MLRLQAFLAEKGYEFEHTASKYEVVTYLAELVAFRVLTTHEALVLLDVDADDSYFWQVARGDIDPYSVKASVLTAAELAETYGAQLAHKRDELLPRDGPRKVVPTIDPAPPDSAVQTSTVHPHVVMTCGALLNCLPYLKALDIERNPDVAAQVREFMGADNFYQILDLLKSMSSREAGKFYRSHS